MLLYVFPTAMSHVDDVKVQVFVLLADKVALRPLFYHFCLLSPLDTGVSFVASGWSFFVSSAGTMSCLRHFDNLD